MIVELFADRMDAGRRLADRLQGFDRLDPVVLGLPRGGVPVAYQVARVLGAPLDVLIVRKLGVPYQPELAFGAIGEGGVRILTESVLRYARISAADIATVEAQQRAELLRRAELYRRGRLRVPLAGRVALIVDDGFATGSTARAAAMIARQEGASRVVLAAPIGARDTITALAAGKDVIDEVVCLTAPAHFAAVGQGYLDFSQTPDEEVCRLLQRVRAADPTGGTGTSGQ